MIALSHIDVTEAEGVTEPVTPQEAKEFMQVDYDDHDGLIEDLIIAARQDIEMQINLALVEKSVVVHVNCDYNSRPFVLPYTRKADAVTVTDLDSEVVITDEDYSLHGNSLRLRLYGAHSVAYDISPDVPASLTQAIKMLVAYRYNNRGDQKEQQGIPADIKAKISKYVVPWL